MTRSNHPVDALTDAELLERTTWIRTDMDPSFLESFLKSQLPRFRYSLQRIPPARSAEDRLLDVGCYAPMIPWYVDVLGYRRLSAIALERRAFLNERVEKTNGAMDHHVDLHFFNVEEDPWPFEEETFDVALCLEVLEHMASDPMHMLAGINRALKPGGLLVLTTPNSASWGALARVMIGQQPYSFSPFYGIRGLVNRHNREYTVREIEQLTVDAGFDVVQLTTFGEKLRQLSLRAMATIAGLPGILTGKCPPRHRGSKILVAARKAGPVRTRWPKWLYTDPLPFKHKLEAMGEEGRRRLEEWGR